MSAIGWFILLVMLGFVIESQIEGSIEDQLEDHHISNEDDIWENLDSILGRNELI